MPSAVISASASGDNTVVAGTAGYAIRVLGYVLSWPSAAVNATWKSDVGGGAVALSGTLFGPLAAGAPRDTVAPVVGPGTRGWFQTAAGKALNLNLSAAVAVGGHVVYELVAQ